MSIFAVTVVGGGLGSYFAWELSKKGWKVRLYERNPRRHVVCGGLVNNRTLMEFSFLEEYAIHPVDGAYIAAGSEEVVVERRRVAWVLDRDEMFRGMLDRAVSEGAEVNTRPWKGEESKLLIGADGALSLIRGRVTRQEVRYILGFQGESRWKEDDRYVRVDFGDWSPNFFGWVIPTGDGKAHVGVGVPLEKAGRALTYLKHYGKRLNIQIERPEGRVIPISPPLLRVARKNVMLVGDAGVFTKASTGGGISYGLFSMRSFLPLVDAFLAGDAPLERVNSLHRKVFYPQLLIHWMIHKFYNTVDMEQLLRHARELGVDEYLSKEGDMESVDWLFSPVIGKLIFRTSALFWRTLP